MLRNYAITHIFDENVAKCYIVVPGIPRRKKKIFKTKVLPCTNILIQNCTQLLINAKIRVSHEFFVNFVLIRLVFLIVYSL